MHADIEQLLAIRDGEVCQASDHVASCELCQAELAQLRYLQQQILLTADQAPSADVWNRILVSGQIGAPAASPLGFNANFEPTVPPELVAASSLNSKRWASISTAIYTLAFAVFFTGSVSLYSSNQQPQQTEMLQASINDLMLNSRGLERVLQRASIQEELLSGDQRSLVDRLHWRLMHVDQMIQENNTSSQVDTERARSLWNDRVDTLTELNQLYFQRQTVLADSEI